MNRLALIGLGLLWFVGTFIGFLTLIVGLFSIQSTRAEDSNLGQAGLLFMVVLWVVGGVGLKRALPRVGWWSFFIWPFMQVMSLVLLWAVSEASMAWDRANGEEVIEIKVKDQASTHGKP